MATLQASRMGTLQASRLFGFLTWLIVTACVCGEISTDAEHDDNHIPSFVLVYSMEEVKSGTPISIRTDTEYAINCEKYIVLDINGSRAEAEIYHDYAYDSIHLTINGVMTDLSSNDINDLKMNLKGQELKHGRNKLVLQNSSSYVVRVFSQTLQYEQLLQTINITKYFHLYLFAPPKIEYDKNHGRLLCHVNHTGANEYGNWIIEFNKETLEGKKSVENCTKHTTLYYDMNLDVCIMQLHNPVRQQDAGNYSCALHIRHAETDKLTTFQRQTDTKEVPISQPSKIPISLIVPSVVGSVFIILFVVIIPVGIILRHCRQCHHQQAPQQNAHQDPPAQPPRQQSPEVVLQDHVPEYGSFQDLHREQESPLIPPNLQPSQQQQAEQREYLSSPNFLGSPPLRQHPVESPPPSSSSGSPSDNNLSTDDETSLEQNTRAEGRHGAASGGGANVSEKNKRKKRVQRQEHEEREN